MGEGKEPNIIIAQGGLDGTYFANNKDNPSNVIATLRSVDIDALTTFLEQRYSLDKQMTPEEEREAKRITKIYIPALKNGGKVAEDAETVKLMEKLGMTRYQVPGNIASYYKLMREEGVKSESSK